MREAAAAHLQGMSYIGQIRPWMLHQVVGQLSRHHVERGSGFRRQQQKLRSLGRQRGFGPGCFFDDNVRVGAAYTEAADPRAAWLLDARPRRQAGIDDEWTLGEIDLRIRPVKVNAGGQLFCEQRHG